MQKIIFAIRLALTWLNVRLFWSRIRTSTIRRFAETEADSAWQLAVALRHANNTEERAALFAQILEEMNHAELFRCEHKRMTNNHFIPLAPERRSIQREGETTAGFHAYCVIGEQQAFEQFSLLAKVIPDEQFTAVLQKILRDEAKHVHQAEAHTPDRRLLRPIRIRRNWENWQRQGLIVTDALSTALLTICYFVVGPCARLLLLRHQQPTKVTAPKLQERLV
jgi:rubrerythrin